MQDLQAYLSGRPATGASRQVGTPLDLYNRPVNTFVAGFIGSPRMNFIPVQSLSAQAAHSFAPQHAHEIGIRPEHLSVCGEHEGLTVTVKNTEYMGSQTLVQGVLADGTKVEALLQDTAPPTVNSTLHLNTTLAHIHRFDAQGLALGNTP